MKLVLYDPAWPLYRPLLEEALETRWQIAAGASDAAWLRREIEGADALIATALPPDLRGAARNLRALFYPGAGVAHANPLELPEGCRMANVFEHETPMAEYVLMAILMHVTRVREHEAAFRRGEWLGSGRAGGATHGEALGKTVGLVGYGHIGREVARRARAFGMRVHAIRRAPGRPAREPAPDWTGGPADAAALAAASDFLVVACPLTESTRGMIGRRELEAMPRHAYLINVSRAEIVEEDALYEFLRDGRIAGAALDVWYQYPERAGEVRHGSCLPFHELPNVLATPHFSAWTDGTLRRRMRAIARNLDRLARGDELERVVMVGAWREDRQ